MGVQVEAALDSKHVAKAAALQREQEQGALQAELAAGKRVQQAANIAKCP